MVGKLPLVIAISAIPRCSRLVARVQVVSYHLSLVKAKKFASRLEKMGATGVRIGKKTYKGYPVYSRIC